MQVLRGNKTADTEEMQNLVEGAKLFVDTQVEHLNENEYVAARWNGKRIVKPDDKNNTARLNIYYNNMLQVYIDRSRIAINNGEEVAFRPAKLSKTYSYINSVSDKAKNYYLENS